MKAYRQDEHWNSILRRGTQEDRTRPLHALSGDLTPSTCHSITPRQRRPSSKVAPHPFTTMTRSTSTKCKNPKNYWISRTRWRRYTISSAWFGSGGGERNVAKSTCRLWESLVTISLSIYRQNTYPEWKYRVQHIMRV
jgi:hypothetical protein